MATTDVSMKTMRGSAIRVAMVSIFSALVFVASLLNRYTLQGAQILFAIVYGSGVLVLGYPGAATSIALIAGSIYMFQSSLGFLILASFGVRGASTDLLFLILGIYKDARNGIFKWTKISAALILSSFLTGLFHYIFFVFIMKKLIDFGAFIVSAIFITAMLSNGVGGYIVAKYIMPRVSKLGVPI